MAAFNCSTPFNNNCENDAREALTQSRRMSMLLRVLELAALETPSQLVSTENQLK